MANTTNFGWETPDDTDLVKDGALAMRTLGNAIDTSLVDLKGGTTGQILAKNTNADMDFVWIANDQGDITAVTAGTGLSGGGTSGAVTITNDMATTITAAGDIVVGTGSGTYDNLPIGTTGQVLTADTTVSPYKVKWAAASGGLTIGVDTVATEESTTSGSFTDLATVGPTVTLTTGTKAWVIISARMKNSSAGEWPQMGVEVSGASSVSPNFGKLATFIEPTANYQWVITASFTYTGLTAGSNTFKAKYRTYTSGTATFVDRYIQVIDLGS